MVYSVYELNANFQEHSLDAYIPLQKSHAKIIASVLILEKLNNTLFTTRDVQIVNILHRQLQLENFMIK